MNHAASLITYGRLEYAEALDLQHRLRAERESESIPDTLVLLEHPAVFTIGRSGRSEHWGENEALLRDTGVPVHHVERGGSITYHGPGQLIGYPVLKLATFCPGPKVYMSMLEEVLIRTLADWDLAASRIAGLTGVWVGHHKIAAMGVRIIRGITMHGFALNVDMDLAPFSRIVPCGIADCRVTSMAVELSRTVDRAAVRAAVARHFACVFDLEWNELANGPGSLTGKISAPYM